ncbi:MAG: hypothetical protein IT353_07820 [Gemmatimonadaceae bacterium]|nr:hypothetical protein [Gemmatimonadaceae bacterium]
MSARNPVMSVRTMIALTFAVVSACAAPTATRPDAAYNPTTLTGGVRYRWSSGALVRVWIVNSASGAPLNLGQATRAAMLRWNAVPQFAEVELVAASSIDAAEVVIYDNLAITPIRAGQCAFDTRSAAGYTYFCPDGAGGAERLLLEDGSPSAVQVLIRVDPARVTSQQAFNALVAHEFGHALGIGGHSDVGSDLMFGLPAVEVPSERDRATLRAVLSGAAADTELRPAK